jgi:spore maturation protein CgeB
VRIALYIGRGIAAPYIVKSSGDALQKSGHAVQFVPIREENQDISPLIHDFFPDLVIALDHTGINDAQFAEAGVFYCSWFVDHPYYYVDKENFNAFHLAAVTDTSFRIPLEKIGCKQIFSCPLAYDPAQFSLSSYPAEQEQEIEASYVGSFSDLPDVMRQERLKQFHPFFNRIVAEALEIKKSIPSLPLLEVLGETEKTLKNPFLKNFTAAQIGAMIHMVDTELDAFHKMEMVQGWDSSELKIFGNDNWKHLLGQMQNVTFMGGVVYDQGLSQIYRKTKVNLIVTRPQIARGVNQRVFDVAAAGGFFLCDEQEELKNLFPSVWERIVYTNFTEMKDKVRYFLSQDRERKEIAGELNRCIRENHTYQKRMDRLIGELTPIVQKNEKF